MGLTAGKPHFLDSSYAIALLSPKDQYHPVAMELSDAFLKAPVSLVTTQAIIFEVCSSLAKPPFRKAALEFLDGIEMDGSIEVVPVTEPYFDSAIDLFKQRRDKSWSLTDCFSFVVMNERAIEDALTSDEHFEQAGFRALLRE